ncbi:acyl-CoA carboxylase subunit beta [Sneathiella glossodoripedis]|uniref:acyl-CoA carboxylase subunit beta n=1 Tax=Sneathiella glossodoripedis TaxID=418853 RepID=UPI0004729832|nr:carboxyl transferase domain-containing protein [Sneathiella glossodoripedis]
MSWKKEVQELEKLRAKALAMGGKEALEKHHAKGRLGVRERIDILLDKNSFQEHGSIAGGAERDDEGKLLDFTPANYVTGLGTIENRPVAVGGEDFTVKGGSPNAAGLRKSIYAEELALQYKRPLIRLLEGGGGSVAGAKSSGPVGNPVYERPRFQPISKILSVAPVASAALGPVAGFPAARFAASHFSVMTKETAQILIAGPAVVSRALDKNLTKEDLGSAKIHSKNGVATNIAKDEVDALEQIKTFLSFLPTNVWQLPPVVTCTDDVGRCADELLDIVPKNRRQPFNMRKLIKHVVDNGFLFEMNKSYGPSLITAFARMNGQAVGVIGNDCKYYAGAMGANAAIKVRRFIELCDIFHLPIINFVDEPGFMIGPDSEQAGTIRFGTSAVATAVSSVVPWASIIVKKAFGVAAAAHFSDNSYTIAWPSAEMGALPVEGGVAVAFRRQIEQSDDPERTRTELEAELAAKQSPLPRGESFSVHDVIDPRETRPHLCNWIEWIRPGLEELKGPVTFGYRP